LITVLCGYLAWDILSNRDRLDTLTNNYPEYPIPSQDDSAQIVDSTQYEVKPLPTDTQSSPVDETPAEPSPEPPVKQTPPAPTGDACYVVVGAFADPANIVRMEERLSSLGYTSEQLKGRSITRVAIRTSCDKESLNKVLSEARASINPEAWIY
jgi:cell division septation protein DedD